MGPIQSHRWNNVSGGDLGHNISIEQKVAGMKIKIVFKNEASIHLHRAFQPVYLTYSSWNILGG